MKCLDCKHLHEGDDPGGGEWTGPGGGQSLSCGLGKWYLNNGQLAADDLRVALTVAASCVEFVQAPDDAASG
jgi:hypothetical protein